MLKVFIFEMKYWHIKKPKIGVVCFVTLKTLADFSEKLDHVIGTLLLLLQRYYILWCWNAIWIVNDKAIVNELSVRISKIDFFRCQIDLGVNCAKSSTLILGKYTFLFVLDSSRAALRSQAIAVQWYCFTENIERPTRVDPKVMIIGCTCN